MEIPILVEPVSGNGFRATSGSPLGLQIEAPTREEAINKLRDLIDRRISAGAEVVGVETSSSRHPLAPFAGMLRDDPLLQPWKDAIAEYRVQTNSSESQ
jgi:hypothetical protein